MRITKNFTTEEMQKTNTGLPNLMTQSVSLSMMTLCSEVLQPLRDAYGKPITVNSGYRSPAVNKAVGGVKNSQHCIGEAADITGGSPAENKKLFQLAQDLNLDFDQLIDEKGYQWLHISYTARRNNRRQILHLK